MAILPFLVPGLRSLLGLVPLSLAEWLLVAGIAPGLLVSVEIGTWISKRVRAHDGQPVHVAEGTVHGSGNGSTCP